MLSTEIIDLVKYRLNKALDDYEMSLLLYNEKHFMGATNRAYYSIFHSIRALLALDAIDFKKHSGVISHFNKEYIKTGIFDVSLSEMISNASLIRNESDYNDFYVVSREDAKIQVDNAKLICEILSHYIRKRISEDN